MGTNSTAPGYDATKCLCEASHSGLVRVGNLLTIWVTINFSWGPRSMTAYKCAAFLYGVIKSPKISAKSVI